MPLDREALDETEFERRLLASARGDAGPPDLQGAWARFAGALGPIVSDPALGGDPRATESPVAPRAPLSTHARLTPAVVMKWMLLGAIAGSAATTAVLYRPRQVVASSDIVSPAAGVLEKAVARRPTPPVEAPSAEASRETSAVLHGSRPKRPGEGRIHAPVEKVGGADSVDEESAVDRTHASSLAAEVARLDAARTSNAVGDYDETIRLIERYHREFPDGALAPDAEVVALEAVAAKRDQAETARRAALFLSRYPGDPHAARVRWLAAH
jgi:hypothetical protein